MRTLVLAIMRYAFLTGCDTERLNKLEKENAELKSALDKKNAATDLEMQEKCSKAAKSYFRENFPPDKETMLLNETNHYNKKMNKCFVVVEYHFTPKPSRLLYNIISMWDVYENSRYAMLSEKLEPEDRVLVCEVGATKCKTIDEFNNLIRP